MALHVAFTHVAEHHSSLSIEPAETSKGLSASTRPSGNGNNKVHIIIFDHMYFDSKCVVYCCVLRCYVCGCTFLNLYWILD